MANVYQAEGNYENAYILYIKFMTLFIEKIKIHPEYKTLPAQVKQPNQAKLKEVMPITEKLKVKLVERYQKEYVQFLANKESERIREIERAKAMEKERERSRTAPGQNIIPSILPSNLPATAPDLSLLDSVVYPNDFPSDNSRHNLPSTGLLLPDNDKKGVKYVNHLFFS